MNSFATFYEKVLLQFSEQW